MLSQGPTSYQNFRPAPITYTIPDDVSSRFGRRLRELRKAHKLTQEQMADTFGIDRSFISDMERGNKGVSIATLEVIALGFKMSMSDMFKGI